MSTMADYWHLLNEEDREFILDVLSYEDPVKYTNYHAGHLILIKFSTVKYAVKKAKVHHWLKSPRFSDHRKFKSMKKRILKRLSPALLLQEQQRSWREKQKRRA